jgi:regulation of enolase protein 1 (concanavalin A-like superfamily)
MAIVVQCFQCSTILELDDGFRGGVARCSNCGALLRVPKEVGAAGESVRPHSPAGMPQPRPRPASDPGVSSGGLRDSGRRHGDPTTSSGAFTHSPRPQSPSVPQRQAHVPIGSGISSRSIRTQQDVQPKQSNFLSGPMILGIFLGAVIITVVIIAVWQLLSSKSPQTSNEPGIYQHYGNGMTPVGPQAVIPQPVIPQPPQNNIPQVNPQISTALPNGWSAQDIGSPTAPSTISYSSDANVWTISGIGRDVYGKIDQFSYVSQNCSGNGQIVAQVTSVSDTYDWAKAGVMFRASTDRSAPYVDVFATPSEGVAMQSRVTQGGPSTNDQVPNIGVPTYVMIQRQGNNFSGYYSKDGKSWISISNVTINMNDPIYAGLMVVAHSKTTSCTATFSNVSIGPITQSTAGQ